MALHRLADSTDLRLFVPIHHTYSLTLQLPVQSGLPFESRYNKLLINIDTWTSNAFTSIGLTSIRQPMSQSGTGSFNLTVCHTILWMF